MHCRWLESWPVVALLIPTTAFVLFGADLITWHLEPTSDMLVNIFLVSAMVILGLYWLASLPSRRYQHWLLLLEDGAVASP